MVKRYGLDEHYLDPLLDLASKGDWFTPLKEAISSKDFESLLKIKQSASSALVNLEKSDVINKEQRLLFDECSSKKFKFTSIYLHRIQALANRYLYQYSETKPV